MMTAFLLLGLAGALASGKRQQASCWHSERDLPKLFSQTGLFRDLQKLKPTPDFIPYTLIVPFWSDGASKQRWIRLPENEKIHFQSTGEWIFPSGTVFVKNFELSRNETVPENVRRLETRILVRDHSNGVFGASYKWRADNSEADYVPEPIIESIAIKTSAGMRTQNWYYPGPNDCRVCHNAISGGVLGPKTRQLNCEFQYPDGHKANQISEWNRFGIFDSGPPAALPKFASIEDPSENLELRARSYIDANCAHCHRPGGVVSYFDARFDTPLERQNLVDGPVVIDNNIDKARAIAPHDIWRSLILSRLAASDGTRMPPLAHEFRDERGIALIREWIESMPGPEVLAPPLISPAGTAFKEQIEIHLSHSDPEAQIHYTLDGSAPGKFSAVYEKPIFLHEPATIRARAYRDGFTRSIAIQQTFVFDN
jgi:uncharacterized repeat protein (TIGR03806 family)